MKLRYKLNGKTEFQTSFNNKHTIELVSPSKRPIQVEAEYVTYSIKIDGKLTLFFRYETVMHPRFNEWGIALRVARLTLLKQRIDSDFEWFQRQIAKECLGADGKTAAGDTTAGRTTSELSLTSNQVITATSSHLLEMVDKVVNTSSTDTVQQARDIIQKLNDSSNTPHFLHLKIMRMWWNSLEKQPGARRRKIGEMLFNRFMSGHITSKAKYCEVGSPQRTHFMNLGKMLQDASYNMKSPKDKSLKYGVRSLKGYHEVREEMQKYITTLIQDHFDTTGQYTFDHNASADE